MKSVWFEVDGLQMHGLVTTGRAPVFDTPLVLVHGLGGSSFSMRPLADRLSVLWPVSAPDLPGFGLTEGASEALNVSGLADALDSWMRAADLRRAVLVGSSLGCQVAVELALRRPEVVAALVLSGPTVDPRARCPFRLAVRWMRNAAGERPSTWAVYARSYSAAGPWRLLQSAHHMARDPFEEKLPRVVCPALVTRGSRDPIVPQRWAEEVARRLPDGRLVVIPGAWHALNVNAPAELARETTRFLLDRRGDLDLGGAAM